jgi:hypothetical protein
LLIVLFLTDVQVYAQVDIPPRLGPPQQNLVTFARRRDVPVLDLLPLLRAHQTEDLFYDQAHLKPIGHQLVAAAMAETLRQYSFVPLP